MSHWQFPLRLYGKSYQSGLAIAFPFILLPLNVTICSVGNFREILKDSFNSCIIRDFSCDKNVKILGKIFISQILGLYWDEWNSSLIKFSGRILGFINERGIINEVVFVNTWMRRRIIYTRNIKSSKSAIFEFALTRQ